MPIQICPRCKSICDISEEQLRDGKPFECSCGCKFEMFPKKDPGVWSAETIKRDESASPGPRKPEPRKWPDPLSLSIAGGVTVGTLWTFGWLVSLFLTSLMLSLFFLQRKRSWKEYNNRALWYFLFDKCLEFFMPLTLVTLFYALLSLAVAGTSDKTTLARLELFEGVLDSIKSLVTYFKFKPWIAALIIALLIFVDFLASRYIKPTNIASHYKDYHKWTKRVYTVAVLLCSFTFFGNKLGEQIAYLRLRTDKIKSGYTRVREEAESRLLASVQREVFEKLRLSFPSRVRDILDYPSEMDHRVLVLRQNYEEAKNYGITNEEIQEILKRYEIRAKQTSNFKENPIRYDEPKPNEIREQKADEFTSEIDPEVKSLTKSPSSKTTGESVEKVLSDLRNQKSSRARLVSLIKLDSVKELLCQFPKSFTAITKSAVFKSAMETYPILDPIVEVFVGTFDKSVEQRVRVSADKIADALLENPGKTEEIISAESRMIAASVNVETPETVLKNIMRRADKIEEELNEINEANQKAYSLLQPKREQEAARLREKELIERRQEAERKLKEATELIDCYCVCSRDGIRRFAGVMTAERCNSICRGPC